MATKEEELVDEYRRTKQRDRLEKSNNIGHDQGGIQLFDGSTNGDDQYFLFKSFWEQIDGITMMKSYT